MKLRRDHRLPDVTCAPTTMKIPKLKRLHIVGPLLCLLPLGFSALQDPEHRPGKGGKGQEKKEKVFADDDFFGTTISGTHDESLLKHLQGCWKLASIKADDYPSRGIDLLGYLLVSGPFMSLEVQAFWDDTLEEPPRDAFETFVGEVRPAGKGAMQVQILMGSFMDRDQGNLEWYQSDRPERFALTLPDAETLVMEWRGKRKMTFRRHRSQTQVNGDFYGAGLGSKIDDFYDQSNDPVVEEEVPREEDEEGDEVFDDEDEDEDSFR